MSLELDDQKFILKIKKIEVFTLNPFTDDHNKISITLTSSVFAAQLM